MTTRGELARGTRLGKYEIHGRLSVGGMAELYLASLAGQGGFRKFVALKRVLPSIASNEDFTRMFLDEARITASLSHAGIAQVFELTEDTDTREPILAMEFVAGQNLEQIIQRARKRKVPLPPEFSGRMATDVLLALHYAHGFVEPATGQPMAVIHRDINPRNVMITYAGGTKIIDFGIAKARGRLNETSAGFVKGTIQYMAPEQVMSKTGIDGRADLFALSIVLYEMLSNTLLFDAPSPAATMSKVIHEPIPNLGDLVPSLPGEVVDVVMKGLQRDPASRWQNGREYARALDRALPDSFDEQQMAEVMSSLFEDKIAVTRSLLSSAESASASDLKLMTMTGDEEPAKKQLASDVVAATAIARPAVRKPTSEMPARKPVTTEIPVRKPTREQLAANERTEMNLEPVRDVPHFPDEEKTVAVMPSPTIKKLEPTPERKNNLVLYVVLAVLAATLFVGAIALFN
ncbi:MAG: serine/threonine-protein kinase [Archangium sp.]|nr:serine/threonine-protein kinase [Archangium sp.]MDP3575592.1 serine/threonine-protein kinase [Archangium sp.]